MITTKPHHPKVLPIFFLTEMWERFGFYIAQGLLILFMTHHLGFSDEKGYTVLGGFTALAYIMPVIGGFVADKILGFKNTIILGNIFLILGYGALAIPGDKFFYLALALIVTGTGFFKPNISSYLGHFYQKDDPLREGGFTIFYMGINLGSVLATSLGGWVQEVLGWHSAFMMACMGLIIGFFIFIFGMQRVKQIVVAEHQPRKNTAKTPIIVFLKKKIGLLCLSLVMIAISIALMMAGKAANLIFWTFSLVLFVGLVYMALRYEVEVRNKLIALIFLIIASIVFWAIFFQIFFSVNLFVDRVVNRHWFGIEIPTLMFISLEAFFIFALGPVFARIWHFLNDLHVNPSVALKFAIATFMIGLAFLWIILGIHSSATGAVNPMWVVLTFLFVTISELLLSPIGLSAVTTLAPPNLVGFMMGVWFVALGLGGKLAGIIASISSVPENITDPKAVAPYYLHAFWQYVWFGIGMGCIILLATPILRAMAMGKNPSWKAALSWRK